MKEIEKCLKDKKENLLDWNTNKECLMCKRKKGICELCKTKELYKKQEIKKKLETEKNLNIKFKQKRKDLKKTININRSLNKLEKEERIYKDTYLGKGNLATTRILRRIIRTLLLYKSPLTIYKLKELTCCKYEQIKDGLNFWKEMGVIIEKRDNNKREYEIKEYKELLIK